VAVKTPMDWKRILIGKWSWKRPFISLASIYFLLFIIAVFFADRVIFIPPPASYSSDDPGLQFLKTSEGESIACIHLPAAEGMPTILYSHGNEEDLKDSQPLYDEFHASGLGVFAYDYPGYGVSTGTPNEESTQRAIMACWKHLTAKGIPPCSIVIAGRSVGSGPSVWLASQTEPAGLFLISPFKSAFTTAFDLRFPLFPRDRFPNLDRIRHFDRPLLVIHGEDDEVIPVRHGRALVEACPSQDKKFQGIPHAGHNDLFEIGYEEIFQSVIEFAKRVAK
jgi:alpha-beta hydrolase superfamily lysophospholipase